MNRFKTYFLATALLLISSSFIQAQIVTIPDANFKAALVANAAINTNGDTEIQVSEAAAFSGTINVNSQTISSLVGIEAFTSLTILYCKSNQLTSLDVSANTALTQLFCQSNQLTSLDVSANTALTILYCYSNQLTSLDVSTNTALTILYCHLNQLTSLDVSTNTALKELYCQSNQLTSLDVSTSTALIELSCQDNQLSSLNIKNGNNSNIPNGSFNALTNPNLTCIEVDDAAWSTTNWLQKDATATYNTACITSVSTINTILPNLKAYPNPTTSAISLDLGDLQEEVSVSVINTMGQKVFERTYNSTQQIDLELDGAAGIYILRLQTSKGENSLKVIKN